jgi:hypothetical protein
VIVKRGIGSIGLSGRGAFPGDPGEPRRRYLLVDFADIPARIAEHPVSRLDDLLPWDWRKHGGTVVRAA